MNSELGSFLYLLLLLLLALSLPTPSSSAPSSCESPVLSRALLSTSPKYGLALQSVFLLEFRASVTLAGNGAVGGDYVGKSYATCRYPLGESLYFNEGNSLCIQMGNERGESK